jgi:hypothetical protein
MIHRLLPSMIDAGKGGKIVTVASDAGRRQQWRDVLRWQQRRYCLHWSLARDGAVRHQLQLRRLGPTATPLFLDATAQKLQEAPPTIPLARRVRTRSARRSSTVARRRLHHRPGVECQRRLHDARMNHERHPA